MLGLDATRLAASVPLSFRIRIKMKIAFDRSGRDNAPADPQVNAVPTQEGGWFFCFPDPGERQLLVPMLILIAVVGVGMRLPPSRLGAAADAASASARDHRCVYSLYRFGHKDNAATGRTADFLPPHVRRPLSRPSHNHIRSAWPRSPVAANGVGHPRPILPSQRSWTRTSSAVRTSRRA